MQHGSDGRAETMVRHHGKFVSYLRVSTKRQGESGLGLEAQRAAVEIFLNGGNWQLVEEHVEIESSSASGTRAQRRQNFNRLIDNLEREELFNVHKRGQIGLVR